MVLVDYCVPHYTLLSSISVWAGFYALALSCHLRPLTHRHRVPTFIIFRVLCSLYERKTHKTQEATVYAIRATLRVCIIDGMGWELMGMLIQCLRVELDL